MLFSNGCIIEPALCEIDGAKKYRFIVTSFEDDVCLDGKVVPLRECAETLQELIACEFKEKTECSMKWEECNGCGFIEEFKNRGS